VADIFVPVEAYQAMTDIGPGSGIVGYPFGTDRMPGASDSLNVYFEGNIYEAENLKKWTDKVRQAYGRMVLSYPTIAKSIVAADHFQMVGNTDGNVVTITDMPALQRWLAFSNKMDSAPASDEERLPERYRPR
jgi:hypothetical protein